MAKRFKIPDVYTTSRYIVRIFVIVLCVLVVIWAIKDVPSVVHYAF